MKRNGFSLVELMVALLLGSLISIAATQLFLVNRQADNLQQGLSSIQDQGRFIVNWLTRDLMGAGYDDLAAIEPFEFDSAATHYSFDDTRNDELVVKMSSGADCRGAEQAYPLIKRYRVVDNNLMCSERVRNPPDSPWKPGNSEALINNVEAFQVLYGVDLDTTIGQEGYGYADAYADADTIRSSIAAGAPSPRIVSVRFAVLLSGDRRAGVEGYDPIALLDQTIDSEDGVVLDDGRLYRTYTSTVALRNLAEL